MEEGNTDVTFTINGKVYKVDPSIPVTTTLVTFIREVANLTGTKYMCSEGGCGACVVSARTVHPVTHMEEIFTLNACMLPVRSCHGFALTTIENLGDQIQGYNAIQSQLVNEGGSQCGYCSPGMVMNLYSLLQSNPTLSMSDIENFFDGNICRCTGYRPILAAFKSFARDNSENQVLDIEDILKKCPSKGKICSSKMNPNNAQCELEGLFEETLDFSFIEIAMAPKSFRVKCSHSVWYKVSSKSEIFQLFDYIGDSSYKLLAGNTAKGVFPEDEASEVYIDIRDVPELRMYQISKEGLQLGGNMTLNEVINLFSAVSKENPTEFDYLKVLQSHLLLVANSPIRNIATIGGNLMMKYYRPQFNSDIFTIMETVGATATISGPSGMADTMSLMEFLKTNMTKKVISSINLLPLNAQQFTLRTYKVMPRAQNTQAIVNAGFLFKLAPTTKRVLTKPRIVYGGINGGFVHANNTEKFLLNKPLRNITFFRAALGRLGNEINPDSNEISSSPAYLKLLSLSLYYRFVLSVDSKNLKEFFRSGGTNLQRSLSSGVQEYPTIQTDWPVTKPIPKLEGYPQCSGELKYTNDVATTMPHKLSAQFIISRVGPAEITSIDASNALACSGVVAFYSAKDIQGVNTFTPPHPFVPEVEELFASTKVLYAGQPLGIIVAETRDLAIEAAKLVDVTYANLSKPLLTVDDVLNADDETKSKRVLLLDQIEPTNAQTDVTTKITGELEMGGQFHYPLELQNCIVIPTGLGLHIITSSQWMMASQEAISKVLNIPESSVTVEVRQCGGAFGSKITRAAWLTTAAGLAAYKLNRPVEFVLPLETSMQAIGKRCQYSSKYEVGVDPNGKIKYMNLDIYENVGCSLNDPVINFTLPAAQNGYDISPWRVRGFVVKTDLPSSVWMRAPGSLEAVTSVESIMERIAFVLKKDPVAVRLQNLVSGSPTPAMIQSLQASSNFQERMEGNKNFNLQNRWTKRGLAITQMAYPIQFFLNFYSMVSVYYGDGSAAISHGGIEIGQGINTKAAQVCAYTLGIPLELVKIKPSNNISSPNSGGTGGSITSDTVAYATMRCCEELNQRLEPIRQEMKNPTWQELVSKAYLSGINLNASYMWTPDDPIPKDYRVYGIAATEVEVDVLTGQMQILRADILQDCGKSISPLVDVGQIEGGFIMGLGNFLFEELKYNRTTGQLLTNRTWNYTPPGFKDIPIDFRVRIKQNAENPVGVLGSKSTGEPTTCLSCSVLFAIRQALYSARKDAGLPEEWFKFDPPCTPEKILLASGTTNAQFNF